MSQPPGKSGLIGVTWHKKRLMWIVRIYADSEQKHVGLYRDIGEAAKAYNVAARRVHGNKARLNPESPL